MSPRKKAEYEEEEEEYEEYEDDESRPRELLREVAALLVIGFCLYALLALATLHLPNPGSTLVPRGGLSNMGGTFGYYLAHGSAFLFGYAGWLLFFFALAAGLVLFLGRGAPRPVVKVLGAVIFTAIIAVWLGGPGGTEGLSRLAPYGAGGRLGAALGPELQETFGGPGRLLLLSFGALVSLLLATEWLLSGLLQRAYAGAAWVVERVRSLRAGREEDVGDEDPWEYEESDAEEPEAEEEAEEEPEEDEEEEPDEPVKVIRPQKRRSRRKAKTKTLQQELPYHAAYPFPPIELFFPADASNVGATKAVVRRNSAAIARRLASFKIKAEVVGVSMGPAVTQYEVRLGEGVRVGKVVGFEADLAAALKAVSVRVVAPIPGRDTIGVEVPNEDRQLVVMRELLEQFGRAEDMAIPLFLGKDVAGQPIVEDLAQMPHLLVAGTTGSGKSVCLNAILLSILMTRSPAHVRMILIDPKMVELQYYKDVPHLCCEVVSNMKRTPAVLEWAVAEMDRRYETLNQVGVNHLTIYNRLGEAELSKRLGRDPNPDELYMPYVVLVIDELADLMAVAQKEVEDSIQRLAQKSRSVGMHVIIATQRPSTDVITGIIKANLPCQISFKVNRKIDSRVILDANGAEKLLGHGDMLYVPPRTHRMQRAQGTFVADEEIRRVVEYLAEHGPKSVYVGDLVQSQTGSRRGPKHQDELYNEAVEVILGQQRGSATLLQRALAVGYTRATRLLEMMMDDGVVGPFNGSKSRDVLLTLDEWREREAAVEEELEGAGTEDDACETAADVGETE